MWAKPSVIGTYIHFVNVCARRLDLPLIVCHYKSVGSINAHCAFYILQLGKTFCRFVQCVKVQ